MLVSCYFIFTWLYCCLLTTCGTLVVYCFWVVCFVIVSCDLFIGCCFMLVPYLNLVFDYGGLLVLCWCLGDWLIVVFVVCVGLFGWFWLVLFDTACWILYNLFAACVGYCVVWFCVLFIWCLACLDFSVVGFNMFGGCCFVFKMLCCFGCVYLILVVMLDCCCLGGLLVLVICWLVFELAWLFGCVWCIWCLGIV